MPSNAVLGLGDRIAEIDCLLGMYKSRKIRGAKKITSEGQALFRASLVLLCSHVEGFFEDLIDDCVESLDKHLTNTSQFPLHFRMHQVLGNASAWDLKDQAKRWAFIQERAKSPLLFDGARYAPGTAQAETHTDSFATPNADKVRKLFKTLGIEDVWKEFARFEPNIAYRSELDAIVERRGDIAHGDLTAQVGYGDIRQYLTNFERTAAVFDALTQDFLSKMIVGFAW